MTFNKFLRPGLFIIFLLISIYGFSQKGESDIVKLKNGSEIKGKIILEDTEKIEIQTYDKSIWVFTHDEIESKTIIPVKTKNKSIAANGPRFVNLSSIGLLIGRSFGSNFNSFSSPTEASLSLHTFNGIQVTRGFGIGAGFGIDGYQTMVMMPLTLQVTGDIAPTKITPFYVAALGHGMVWLKNDGETVYKGGTTYEIGGGLKVYTGASHHAFTFYLGYKSQKMSTNYSGWGWGNSGNVTDSYTMNRTNFRIGFAF
ncbi:hypothetical protein [Flexithrix dorotheae]|uniref:hypothetical protein n=1 Tax=Flexithrix dorotheae TaxID=70993 RepID=UPI00036EAF18|nr:hypothetical protein [Flexithrix dorotheae]